jgi:hypothetical protein
MKKRGYNQGVKKIIKIRSNFENMSIDISYYSFSPKRADEGWKNFKEDALLIRRKNALGEKDTELNPRQQSLFEDAYSGDLFYSKNPDAHDIKYGMKAIDLYYGAVRNIFFESLKVEFIIVECIVEQFRLKTEDKFPAKNEWIRVFKSLQVDDVDAITTAITKSIGWNQEEAHYGFFSFLRSIKPVVKDLNETNDAIFMSWYGGVETVEPKSSEEFLYARYLEHKEQFQDVFSEA